MVNMKMKSCVFIIHIPLIINVINTFLRTMVLIRITSIQKNWLNRNGGMRMEELISSLNAIPNSYFEFIDSVVDYAERKEEHRILIMNYLNDNRSATVSDVLRLISSQTDFYEDEAPIESDMLVC